MIHNKLFLGIGAAIAMTAALTSCGNDEPGSGNDMLNPEGNETHQSIILDARQSEALDAYTDFSIELYKSVSEAKKDENIVFSPLSASMALSMVANATDGETRKQITDQLLGGCTVETLNALNSTLVPALTKADSKCRVSVLNSFWYDGSLPINEAFLEGIAAHYSAECRQLDFAKQDKALDVINRWASNATGGVIPTVKESLLDNELFVLVNALYFNGKWSTPIEESSTRTGTFHKADGSAVDAPFMHTTARGIMTDDFVCVNLFYGNGSYVLSLYLPNEGKGAADVISSNYLRDYDALADRFFKTGKNIEVRFPKISLGMQKFDLKRYLKGMGISDVFEYGKADFSAMTEIPQVIGTLEQRAVIEMTENGTVAAATTTSGLTSSDAIFDSATFDRPYVYTIREASTGAILFMGQVTDPTRK